MSSSEPSGFYGLHIAPKFLEILQRLQFTQPTPIQQKAIPLAIEGKDLIGIAQTGTGKTLAFGLPMLQNLARLKGQGLVVLPTRELAAQVDETLQRLGRQLGLRTAIIVGGASMERQDKMLRNRPHVLVATPGRLIDHMRTKHDLLSSVKILVLDEADRMLDMGFAPQINQILEKVPKERQTMLFSATMPSEIVTIAQQHMALPVRVEIARPGSTTDQVDQEVLFVSKRNKNSQLERLLQRYRGTVLIFARTKWNAKKLTRDVRHMGHTAAEIHSNRTQAQRREALEGFKKGKYRILVATDIAARGIDVKDIELVVNYDLPSTPDDYVHRIGRTGRAGKKGKAISFAMPEQQRDIKDIERLIRAELRIGEESEPVENAGLAKKEYRQQKQHFHQPGGHHRPRRHSGRRSNFRRDR